MDRRLFYHLASSTRQRWHQSLWMAVHREPSPAYKYEAPIHHSLALLKNPFVFNVINPKVFCPCLLLERATIIDGWSKIVHFAVQNSIVLNDIKNGFRNSKCILASSILWFWEALLAASNMLLLCHSLDNNLWPDWKRLTIPCIPY